MNWLEQLAGDLFAADPETDEVVVISVDPSGSSPFNGKAKDEEGNEFAFKVCLNLEDGTAWLSNGWCRIGGLGQLTVLGQRVVTK